MSIPIAPLRRLAPLVAGAALAVSLGACSSKGDEPSASSTPEEQALAALETSFQGSVVAVLPFDATNPACTGDPTLLDVPTLAACTGMVADMLPATMTITTDPLEFDPTQTTESVLALWTQSADPNDSTLHWYAVVGIGTPDLIDPSSSSTSNLRPQGGAIAIGAGADALEALGLLVPGAGEVLAGTLLLTTALVVADEFLTAHPDFVQNLLNSVSNEATTQAVTDQTAEAEPGTCDTDQECCAEDGTGSDDAASSSSSTPAPADQGAEDVEVEQFTAPQGRGKGYIQAIERSVQALNTQTGQVETVDYLADAKLKVVGGDTVVADNIYVWIIKDGEPLGYDYTYRPGMAAMKRLMDSVAQRVAQEFPAVSKLKIVRKRATEGYQGTPCRTKDYDLSRFR